MKTGLLVYQTNPTSNIFNIGDYIQSLAASQFFDNKIDVYLNREHLNEWEGEKVKLIMNGWFMHQPHNWPPSTAIHPLFVAFHLNSSASEELLSSTSTAYFKQNEPIGCRDYNSVKLLQSKGVDAYYSGCMTLTLGKSYKQKSPQRKCIYITDAYYEVGRSPMRIIQLVIVMICKLSVILAICKNKHNKLNFRSIIHSASFYQIYSQFFADEVLQNAEYIQHEIPDTFNDESEKFEYAKKLLNKYANAKLVITSRIHCALPCLSLETPVLYVDNQNQPEISACRLDGLKDLFNIIKYNKYKLTSDLAIDQIAINTPLTNKTDYIKYKNELSTRCEEFVKS